MAALKDGIVVRVIDTVNDSLTACKATDYVVDGEAAQSLVDWQSSLGAVRQGPAFNFTVLFLSDDGKEVGAFTRSVPRMSIVNSGFVELNPGRISNIARMSRAQQQRSLVMLYVSPFIGGSASCFYVWKSFELPKDDLPKVSAMSIEVAE